MWFRLLEVRKRGTEFGKKVWNVLLTSHPLTIFASVTSTRTLGLRKKERKRFIFGISAWSSPDVQWKLLSIDPSPPMRPWVYFGSLRTVKQMNQKTLLKRLQVWRSSHHWTSILDLFWFCLYRSSLRNQDLCCITEPLVLKDYNYLFSAIMHSQGEVILNWPLKPKFPRWPVGVCA